MYFHNNICFSITNWSRLKKFMLTIPFIAYLIFLIPSYTIYVNMIEFVAHYIQIRVRCGLLQNGFTHLKGLTCIEEGQINNLISDITYCQ